MDQNNILDRKFLITKYGVIPLFLNLKTNSNLWEKSMDLVEWTQLLSFRNTIPAMPKQELRKTVLQQIPLLLENFTIRYRGKTATEESLQNLFLRGIDNALPLDEMRRLYQTRLFKSTPSVKVHFSVLKEDPSNPDTGSKVIHEQTQFCRTSAELDEILDQILVSDCIQNLAPDEYWICKIGYEDIDKLVRRLGKRENNQNASRRTNLS